MYPDGDLMRGELISFKVSGFKELDQALKDFPLQMQRKALDQATRAGAKVVEREAKARWDRMGIADVVTGMAQTRNRTGLTRRKIRVTKSKDPHMGSAYQCSISRYGMFVELGTKGHFITAKRKKLLARRGVNIDFEADSVTSGWSVFGKKVRHPGTVAKPFLRPAFYNNIAEIIETERKYLTAWLLKQYRAKYGTYSILGRK
jgi:HK97 gp10 family phage protein